MSDNLLKGFEIVASDSTPFITLDGYRRFYLNTSARRLLDAEPNKRFSLAYNPITKSIAFIVGGSGLPFDMSISSYNVDKRYYMSAHHFSEKYQFTEDNAPYIFDYERGSSDGNIFVFTLRQE